MAAPHKSPSARKEVRSAVPFREAFLYWFKLGFINFGGPAGQIAIMHEELVERRRWISNDRFLHALNYCMMLPGPEAQQLAIYIGWLLHRTIGGLIAGVFFILPGFFVILGLSWIYALHGKVPAVAAAFHGLRAAVVAIVAAAVLHIGSKALRHPVKIIIATAAFVAIFFVKVPFPAIIVAAALFGLVGLRIWPQALQAPAPAESPEETQAFISDRTPLSEHTRPTLRRSILVLIAGLAAWWGPLLAVRVWCGADHVLWQAAVFFSKAAMVTFGGAYAVLAYIAQAAVEWYGWLKPGEMLDGLGLAESTPGPLIQVTQFVGFLGAYRLPGQFDPLLAGIFGAIVTMWATFAPCFLWILLGAPFIEHLRRNQQITAALSAVTAAIVGVVLNLAVWFGLHTLFPTVREKVIAGITLPVPRFESFDLFAFLVAGVAFFGMWRHRWPMIPVVAGSTVAGLIFHFVSG